MFLILPAESLTVHSSIHMLALEVNHSRGLYFSCSFDLQGLYDKWNICYGDESYIIKLWLYLKKRGEVVRRMFGCSTQRHWPCRPFEKGCQTSECWECFFWITQSFFWITWRSKMLTIRRKGIHCGSRMCSEKMCSWLDDVMFSDICTYCTHIFIFDHMRYIYL